MPANSALWYNIARVDPVTGNYDWIKYLYPFPQSLGNQTVYRLIPVEDGSGDMLALIQDTPRTCLCRIEPFAGYTKWYVDQVITPAGVDTVTFGYDNVSHIIVAAMQVVSSPAYELRGIDPADGSTVWSRSFPVYPAGNGIDSVCVYGSQCIVCMSQVSSITEIRSIDTATGADIWTTTAAGIIRVEAIDSTGNWINNSGGTVQLRSGTTGAAISTAPYTALTMHFGPGGYCGVGSASPVPAVWATGGTGLTKSWNLTAPLGATFFTPLSCCSDSSSNYYFGCTTFSTSSPSFVTFFKTGPSGSVIWAKRYGAAGSQGIYGIAIADDGYLWIAGSTTR
ncbi:hypothetical protein [Schlesneria paludicola]|uniref:hypothetical protein n=1 Tax=Schlesneria paludicola TaxID=360056 RepID=UPI00029B5578|nr:hypothetical protein [Schlesneria paludicola]